VKHACSNQQLQLSWKQPASPSDKEPRGIREISSSSSYKTQPSQLGVMRSGVSGKYPHWCVQNDVIGLPGSGVAMTMSNIRNATCYKDGTASAGDDDDDDDETQFTVNPSSSMNCIPLLRCTCSLKSPAQSLDPGPDVKIGDRLAWIPICPWRERRRGGGGWRGVASRSRVRSSLPLVFRITNHGKTLRSSSLVVGALSDHGSANRKV
ncbi:hypothetical protein ACO22_07406, partial [Paracoccidioides brasiliensis]